MLFLNYTLGGVYVIQSTVLQVMNCEFLNLQSLPKVVINKQGETGHEIFVLQLHHKLVCRHHDVKVHLLQLKQLPGSEK
jgi:hypothetical protein